jgi:hypothetical protein
MMFLLLHSSHLRDGLGIPALTLIFIFLSLDLVCLALAAADLLNWIGSIIIPECLITAGRVMSLHTAHILKLCTSLHDVKGMHKQLA